MKNKKKKKTINMHDREKAVLVRNGQSRNEQVSHSEDIKRTYIVHDDIKGADPVGGDKEQGGGINAVEITDFTRGNELEIRA